MKIPITSEPREQAFVLLEEATDLRNKADARISELLAKSEKLLKEISPKDREKYRIDAPLYKKPFEWPFPQTREKIIAEAWEIYKTSSSVRDCEISRMMLQLAGEMPFES